MKRLPYIYIKFDVNQCSQSYIKNVSIKCMNSGGRQDRAGRDHRRRQRHRRGQRGDARYSRRRHRGGEPVQGAPQDHPRGQMAEWREPAFVRGRLSECKIGI